MRITFVHPCEIISFWAWLYWPWYRIHGRNGFRICGIEIDWKDRRYDH